MQNVTQARVRELFDYDAERGVLVWRISQGNRAKVGVVAGSKRKDGRCRVCVDGTQYLAYRVIWLHEHGAWPTGDIDHINGDCTDNRVENLRDVPAQLNAENRHRARADQKSGKLAGAYHSDGGRWKAKIVTNGKAIHLGCFDTEQAAHAAYVEAKRRLHPGSTI